MPPSRRASPLAFCLGWLAISSATAQSPSPSPAAAKPTPIPSAEIVSKGESDLAALNSFSSPASLAPLRERLDRVSHEVQIRRPETSRLLRRPGPGPAIRTEADWTALQNDLGDLKRILKAEADKLKVAERDAAALTAAWTATREKAGTLPPEISARVRETLNRLGERTKNIAAQEAAILSLQNDTANEEGTVSKTISAIEKARNAALGRLLARDSSPLWNGKNLASSPRPIDPASQSDFRDQLAAIGEYLRAEPGRPLLHVAIWLGLIGIFQWARRRVSAARAGAEPRLDESTRIFDVPIAAGSVGAICLAARLYPQAPHLLPAAFGAALVIPLLLVVRKLIEPSLRPLTWALAVFYFTAQFREAVAAVPLLSRTIALVETLAAVIFSLWVIRLARFPDQPDRRRTFAWRTVRFGAGLAAAAFALASAANLLGYVNLAFFVTHVIFSSAFTAILLYVALRILDGLVTFGLRVPPLSLLALVQGNRALLERRFASLFRALAVLFWTGFTLDQAALRKPLLDGVFFFFDHQLRIGPINALSLIEFGLTVWAAFLVSRFMRFVLEEEVYRRLPLAAGLPFALSTLLHYAILFAGFYLAAAILVGDMTKLTILAGAFSVGVGFGLQNIINNFVSGIIVLFERPVKLGDLIQIGADIGAVRRIGIRATVIRTSSGSEIIIPNGKLISDPVTNLTSSDRQRSIDIAIATPTTVDPSRVLELLVEAARSHPKVCPQPGPRAELTKIGGGTFSFELHAAIAGLEDWAAIRSELTMAVHAILGRNGIALA